jgi:hypothetical protein
VKSITTQDCLTTGTHTPCMQWVGALWKGELRTLFTQNYYRNSVTLSMWPSMTSNNFNILSCIFRLPVSVSVCIYFLYHFRVSCWHQHSHPKNKSNLLFNYNTIVRSMKANKNSKILSNIESIVKCSWLPQEYVL